MTALRKALGHKLASRTFTSMRGGWVLPTQKVGIEIETEHVKQDMAVLNNELSMWGVKNDGSLRNSGKEFTTIDDGLFGDDLIVSLEQYFDAAKKYEWATSDRTSIHIHLDVSEMDTASDFYLMCLLYAYFEKPLFRFVGCERDSSTFCLPWHKAQKSLLTVARVCKVVADGQNDFLIQTLNNYQEHEKYSALNIGSLVKYGTVEFRHLANEMDRQKVVNWINIIMCLKFAAKRYAADYTGTKDFMTKLSVANPRLVLEEVFGDYAPLLTYEGIEASIKHSTKVLYDLMYLGDIDLKWELKPTKAVRGSPFQKFLKHCEEK